MTIKACLSKLVDTESVGMYLNCTTKTLGQNILRFNGKDVLGCFLKQYPSLSNDFAKKCVPTEVSKEFLTCMTEAQETFSSFVTKNYGKPTIFFEGNTVGKAFETKLHGCVDALVVARPVENFAPSSVADVPNHFIDARLAFYVCVGVAALAAAAFVASRMCNDKQKTN